MKIARIQQKHLVTRYDGISDDDYIIMTEDGYVYAENASGKILDTFLDDIADFDITAIENAIVLNISHLKKEAADETPLSFLSLEVNKDLVDSHINNTKNISITGLAEYINKPKKFTKEVILLLVNKGILVKDYTYYKKVK